MKNIYKVLLGFVAGLIVFASCSEDKELAKIVNPDKVDAPAITAPMEGDEYTLSKESLNDVALTIKWDKPDYGSNISMSFSIDIDLKDGDFSKAINLGTTGVNTFTITHGDLNQKLIELGLTPGSVGDFDIRIKSSVNYQIREMFSEVITVKATPYSTTLPSIYMIGAAVGGWDPAKAVEVASIGEAKKYFTKAFFDTADGDNFRFFTNPDWGSSLGGWDVFTNYPDGILQPKDGDGDPNFQFIGESGWYELSVDQGTGTIEMKKIALEPFLYLTGDATHGWGWDNPTKLNWIGHETWKGDVTFTQNNFFRCFEQPDWSPVGYGHDIITNYDKNIIIVAEGHGDPNWKFVGTSGTYEVVVDKRAGSITFAAK